ncbi:hypothetical protein VKT23_009260 [Stygiomarasmius scandens]|uniref:F-box domain-containing protein n=1 Tax=Marasmiellus scandens TaxID=2682957 RepID=A0ABR1JEV2_9AGAR
MRSIWLYSALRRIRNNLLPNHSAAKLPPEILQLVINKVWQLPLTKSDRIHFMIVSMLVNRTWLKAFIMTCFRDLVFPSASYFDYIFFTVLSGHSNVISPSFACLGLSPQLLSHSCQSVSFHMEDTRDHLLCSCALHCIFKYIGACTQPLLFPKLYELGRSQNFPGLFLNVRRLVVTFYNVLPSKYDLLRTLTAIQTTELGEKIAELEVEYRWNPETPQCILNVLSSRPQAEWLQNGTPPSYDNLLKRVRSFGVADGWEDRSELWIAQLRKNEAEYSQLGDVETMLKNVLSVPKALRKLEIYGVSEEVMKKIVTHIALDDLVELRTDVFLKPTWLANCPISIEYDYCRLLSMWSNYHWWDDDSKVLCCYDGPPKRNHGPERCLYYYSKGHDKVYYSNK